MRNDTIPFQELPFPSTNKNRHYDDDYSTHKGHTPDKKYGTIMQMEFNTTGQKIKVKELSYDMLFFWGHAICMVNAVGK